MDQVFEILHNLMPVFYILAGLAIVAKAIFISLNRGFDVISIIVSFFKIYNTAHISAASQRRKGPMKVNNYINYFIYLVAALFILMLITYQGNVFTYT